MRSTDRPPYQTGPGAPAVESGQTPQENGLARPRGTENRQAASAGLVRYGKVERPHAVVDVEGHRCRRGGGGRVRCGHERGASGVASWRDAAERDHHGCDGESQCRRSQGGGQADPAELVVGVNRQRERVVGEDDDRPVLTEGAQPRQDHAGADSRCGQRECHVTEPGELGVTERGGHVECGRVDGPERRPGGHDEEGGCAERLREHDAGQRIGQVSAEQLAEERVGPYEVDQQDPAHQRRQSQR